MTKLLTKTHLLPSKSTTSVEEVLQKLQRYCAYQERCHEEVNQKLYEFSLSQPDKDSIVVYLIENNYLNEERFVNVFTMSKLNQKKWGKIRIKNELKLRKISDYLISKALKSISNHEYETIFETLSEKIWKSITEPNLLKKRKKFCETLLRKGWESETIYQKLKQLEQTM